MMNGEQNFQVTIKSDVAFEKHLYRNVLLLFVLEGSLSVDFMNESATLKKTLLLSISA